jgi:toxin ParE1/3/4
MADYRISNQAKEDLIRIHQFGVLKFGMTQADKYFHNFFDHFDIITERPLTFEAVDYIKPGYRRCVCGVDSIFYRISDNSVEIMTIVGRQDTDLIFK